MLCRNKWVKYLCYYVLIILFSYISSRISHGIFEYSQKTYKLLPVVLFNLVSSVMFGCILGIEYFYNEKQKKGKWNVNLPKLAILGIPSLIFSMNFFIMMFSPMFIAKIIVFFFRSITNKYSSIENLMGIFFGFVMITSFYKSED